MELLSSYTDSGKQGGGEQCAAVVAAEDSDAVVTSVQQEQQQHIHRQATPSSMYGLSKCKNGSTFPYCRQRRQSSSQQKKPGKNVPLCRPISQLTELVRREAATAEAEEAAAFVSQSQSIQLDEIARTKMEPN